MTESEQRVDQAVEGVWRAFCGEYVLEVALAVNPCRAIQELIAAVREDERRRIIDNDTAGHE